jgi:DNA-binding MarR family transcriptional regulator
VTEPFPADVVRFLDTFVESIDQLEILRVLGEDPARGRPVSALAAEVQATRVATAAHAAALRGRGLIATEGPEGDPVCRFAPASPELDALTRRVLALYRERPVSMIKYVYARAADPLRAFADAFRLRKEG